MAEWEDVSCSARGGRATACEAVKPPSKMTRDSTQKLWAKERRVSETWSDYGNSSLSWSSAVRLMQQDARLQYLAPGTGGELFVAGTKAHQKHLRKTFVSNLWWSADTRLPSCLQFLLQAWTMWLSVGGVQIIYCIYYGIHPLYSIGFMIAYLSIPGKAITIHFALRPQCAPRAASDEAEPLSPKSKGGLSVVSSASREPSAYVEQCFFTAWKLLDVLIREKAGAASAGERVRGGLLPLWVPVVMVSCMTVGLAVIVLGHICGNHAPMVMGVALALNAIGPICSMLGLDASYLTFYFTRSADAVCCLVDELEIFELRANADQGPAGVASKERPESKLIISDTLSKDSSKQKDLQVFDTVSTFDDDVILAPCQLEDEVRVNWEATFRNFNLMHDFVEAFSDMWQFYFFVAEFALVLGWMVCAMSCYFHGREFVQFFFLSVDVGAGPERNSVCSAMVVVRMMLVLHPIFAVLIIALWCKASNITLACARVRRRSLQTLSDLAGAVGGSIPVKSIDAVQPRQLRVDTSDMERASQLCEYMEKLNTGFSANGWTISYGLGMSIIYPTVMLVVTICAVVPTIVT